MTRLPSLRGQEVIRALRNAGLVVVRIRGSHHILEHPTDRRRRTTVPLHKGKDLPRGLLRRIIADAGLTVEEFTALL
jgi:predicted RNA binding protein YcfA (HicA-like mRNA interferase family)